MMHIPRFHYIMWPGLYTQHRSPGQTASIGLIDVGISGSNRASVVGRPPQSETKPALIVYGPHRTQINLLPPKIWILRNVKCQAAALDRVINRLVNGGPRVTTTTHTTLQQRLARRKTHLIAVAYTESE